MDGKLKEVIYNSEGKNISSKVPDIGDETGAEYGWLSETKISAVVKSKSKGFLLIDTEGNILKNLSDIDSSLIWFSWWSVADNEIMGWNRTGSCYIFDVKGNLITKFKPADEPRFVNKILSATHTL